MRRVEQVGTAVVEHGSPAGRWRRHAESEEAHRGLGENCSSHADRRLHDHRLDNVGQDVTNNNAQVAGAKGARGFDEFAFPRDQHLSADEASVADPSAEGKRENQIEDAGAAKGNEGYGEKDAGEGQEGGHQNDVDEAVDASSVVPGDGADNET